MRIYGGRGRGKLGFINVFLLCENPKISDPVRFYVDTGASRTTISDRDAARLGIDYAELEESSTPSFGIGSKRVKTYHLRSVLLVFRVVGGGFYIERVSVISVLKHEPQTEEEREIVDQIPSLLGADVLQKYNIRFTPKRVVLEK